MKKIVICLLMVFISATQAIAQATVQSMTETTDFIAGDDQRRDYNNQLCALVKVQVVDDITEIEGNVMGDIVNHGVEKWVYLAQGSRNMKIHLKNNLPVTVSFRDYKIKELKSNRVYVLVINAPQTSGPSPTPVGSNVLQMNVSPAKATVYIWGEQLTKQAYKPKDDGTIKVPLPYGRYQYEAKVDGYNTQEGSFFVSDVEEWTDVVLTPIVGTLTIYCPTPKATFYVNGKVVKEENKEKAWTGNIEPGDYNVAVSRKGFVRQDRNVKLEANNRATVNFQELVSEKEVEEEEEMKQREEQKRIEEQKKIERQKQRAAEKEKLSRIKQEKHEARMQRLAQKDKRGMVFGLTAGYNMATAQFGSKYQGETEGISDFHIGLTAECRLSNSFYLNSGLLYSGKGYTYRHTTNDVDEEGKAQYVEIPLLASLRVPLGRTVKLQFCAGPYAAFCIGGDVNDLWGWSRDKESFASAYNSFDYGLQVGVGFDIYYHFHIGANYQLGMASDYANRNLMLGIGYRF